MAHECGCPRDPSGEPGATYEPIRPEEMVGDVVRRRPAALELLKAMGINHCCGAHLTLVEAAAAAGVPLDALLAALGKSADGDDMIAGDVAGPRLLGEDRELVARVASYRSHREAVAQPWPAPTSTGPHRVVLDVRGLEPPEPMVRVLQEADRLGPGAELEVHHDRRPLFLYPQLDERGFVHETDEPEPGLVRILIRRDGA